MKKLKVTTMGVPLLLVIAFTFSLALSDCKGKTEKAVKEPAKEEAAFKDLSDAEFTEAKAIYFDLCSGCHGAKRTGATGKKILPDGTKAYGTKTLETILQDGMPNGMPAWGKEGILDSRQINLVARFIQMPVPPIPKLTMDEAKKNWKLLVKVKDRPTADPTGGKYLNYFGVVLRDIGKVAIIDGTTKKKLAVVDSGKATHILRSSSNGRYMYAIGRDGKSVLIDLWGRKGIPEVVARSRTCWDARSIDSSKAPGYEEKYAIVGCYTPYQYSILDGKTLEPISITSIEGSKDWATNKSVPEVRVATIVASTTDTTWLVALKESGWIYVVDYKDPKNPKIDKIKAENFLHDGGWIQGVPEGDKRFFAIAANAKHTMVIVDVKTNKTVARIKTGKKPHPGRGANFKHPKHGPVFATTHISDDKLVFIGRKNGKWQVMESHKMKSIGGLFVKTHPKSKHLWFDMPLSKDSGTNGYVGVYNIKTNKIDYIKIAPERIVHFEYDKDGKEVWISGWIKKDKKDYKIYVYDDTQSPPKLKKVISGDWINTPTGKFNVTNTMKDIY